MLDKIFIALYKILNEQETLYEEEMNLNTIISKSKLKSIFYKKCKTIKLLL